MGIGTILAHGLGSYTKTKSHMEDQEMKRQAAERAMSADARAQEQHEAWRTDRQAMEAQRGERDALFADLSQSPALDLSGDNALDLLNKERQRLEALRVRAAKSGEPQAVALLNERGQSLLGQWAGSFKGDPTAKPLEYAQHLAKGATVFGKPLTMEQAQQIYSAKKAYDAEGATKALELAHRGDKAGALKAYNEHGNHKFVDLQLVPAKSSSGVPSYNIIGINADGSRMELNAFDGLTRMAGAEQQLKAFIEQQKLQNDTRKTDADVKKSEAAAMASKASAANSYANARRTNEEIKQMKSGLPGGRGGASSKDAAEMLNKYSGWAKSALQIGDTDMSNIDENVAAKRKQVYTRFMGLVESSLARGETPSFEKLMKQAEGPTYQQYLDAFNAAKSAGNTQAMKELTARARELGIAK